MCDAFSHFGLLQSRNVEVARCGKPVSTLFVSQLQTDRCHPLHPHAGRMVPEAQGRDTVALE